MSATRPPVAGGCPADAVEPSEPSSEDVAATEEPADHEDPDEASDADPDDVPDASGAEEGSGVGVDPGPCDVSSCGASAGQTQTYADGGRGPVAWSWSEIVWTTSPAWCGCPV